MKIVSSTLLNLFLTEKVSLYYKYENMSRQDGKICKNIKITDKGEDPFLLLEEIGYETGKKYIYYLAENMNVVAPKQEIDVIKFICKEFWKNTYGKQVNRLTTNYKGLYAIHDSEFRTIKNIFPVCRDTETHDIYKPYIAFSCGLIRGTLNILGYNAKLSATVEKWPECLFHIQITDKNDV